MTHVTHDKAVPAQAGRLLCNRARQGIYDLIRKGTPMSLRMLVKRKKLLTSLARHLFGNCLYSRSYYDDVERLEGKSVVIIAEWISAHISPHSAIDIGCGSGQLLAELNQRGIRVYGVDISSEAIARVREKGLHASIVDLTLRSVALPDVPYDLAISCEVAEHLDERWASTFVEKLTSAAPIIYLTAAEPGNEGGAGLHLNERPNAYWINLMHDAGFVLDVSGTENARAYFRDRDVISYLKSPMLFRRQQLG